MKASSFGLFLLLSACSVGEHGELTQSAADDLFRRQGMILPDSLAPLVLRQCTRRVPVTATGYWSPTVADVQKLELRLSPAIDNAIDELSTDLNPDHYLHASDYYRQYVGIVAGEHRLIYVNAFHRDYLRVSAQVSDRDTTTWRRFLVLVCDGGPGFLGVVYDPVLHRVQSIDFNDGS